MHNNGTTRKTLLTLLFCLTAALAAGGQTAVRNPILWADAPDPDIIRTGDDFWLVTTTMHLMPGAPVMHSRDLIHWELTSYLFDRLSDTPKYDMQGGTVYGRGQWATSLRYHDGTYYALFSPNDEPYRAYIYKTDDPRHGWQLHTRTDHFHDASLFFDDDGRVYVFSEQGRLRELTADLTGLKPGGTDTVVIRRDAEETGLLEGSRVVKYDGRYYLLMISWPQGKPRRQLCYRADRITGPYEKRVILEDAFAGFPYVGQGTIVDAPDGRWYGLIFQDRGAVGRVLTLMPVSWEDGWPMLHRVPETIAPYGAAPGNEATADEAAAAPSLVVSDAFDAPTLDAHWQWNHNPIAAGHSLTERAGWLRLKTTRTAPNLYLAPNTLSQRMEGPRCTATVEMDVSQMRNGDCAGFAAFNGHTGALCIRRERNKWWLSTEHYAVNLTDKEKAVTSVDAETTARIPLHAKRIFLRIDADFRLGRDIATFYYSTNGKQWAPLGGEFQMRFDYRRLFMGTRYALFNYATRQTGGYVDFNGFDYQRKQ
ncbi:MAG: glycoside hydrolase 43 family protein [Prevotella sp.]|nr:glycoside hydrolase 43 family protein [Prevotella sp.]